MLPLPETGIADSRQQHNCDLPTFCDWIEASLLFSTSTKISRTDVIDVLEENSIYTDQSFANAWLDDVWEELRRRERLASSCGLVTISARSAQAARAWDDVPTYAFCVLVSILQHSPGWHPAAKNRAKKTKHALSQGLLFERITEGLLRAAGWSTHLTGWSQSNAVKIEAVVSQIAAILGEEAPSNIERTISPAANEAGLDLVFYRSFESGGYIAPVFLAQCASGANWTTKIHTPELSIWERLIDFSAPPYKAFAMPHALSAEDLRRTSIRAAALVLDRPRLHGWGIKISDQLHKDVVAFMKPLVSHLRTLEK